MFRLSLSVVVLVAFVAACSNLEQREETDDMGYRSVYSVDPETGLKQGAYREYNAEGGGSSWERKLCR